MIKLILILVLTVVSAFVTVRIMSTNQTTGTLKVLSTMRPESTDPILYDSFIHHLIFRSVYSSLLSSYSINGLRPDLAKSWSAKENYTIWEFQIDEQRQFSNGEYVTAEIVLSSLKRIAFLQSKARSKLGLFNHIQGIDKLTTANAAVDGMAVEGNKVILRFSTPQVDLLQRISFGIYGIVHPNDYDQITGEWKSSNSIISSGFYSLEQMNNDETTITLNKYSSKDSDELYQTIKFIHNQQNSILDIDIIFGSSESLVIDENFYFSSPVKSTIRYVVCAGWNTEGNLCQDRDNRKYLRRLFYDYLEKKGLEVVRSFFPTSISGVAPFVSPVDENSGENFSSKTWKIGFLKINPPKKSKENVGKYSYVEGFNDFLQSLHESGKIYLSTDKNEDLVRMNARYQHDLSMNFTGVLIDNPRFDVRFMFLSSEGINLPDEDGRIIEILESDNFDIQYVNKLIWDQAIVWPVNHLSLGLWINKNSRVDLSRMNLSLPPADFRYIHAK